MSSDSFGRFRFLTGDCNYTEYGGKWFWRVRGRKYHVIELLNWIDAVGEREASDVGATYNVSLREVDLDCIERAGEIPNAVRFIGATDGPDGLDLGYRIGPMKGLERDLALVEACHSYGLAAPICEENGNNWRRMMAEVSRYSRTLSKDEDLHAEMMERPVNAIGTSAHDYMTGNFGFRPVRSPPVDECAHFRAGD